MMKLLSLKIFLLACSLIVFSGCTLLSKRFDEVKAVSYENQTFKIKSYIKSRYFLNFSTSRFKQSGWQSPTEAQNNEDKFNQIVSDMCKKWGKDEGRIMNYENKEKTIPVYYSNSVTCYEGKCSGGGGGTILKKHTWSERRVKCISNQQN